MDGALVTTVPPLASPPNKSLSTLFFYRDVVSTNRASHDWHTGRGRYRRVDDRRSWQREVHPTSSVSKAAYGEVRKIVITRSFRHPKKELDYENFVDGCKYLVDALVRCGYLWGDRGDQLQREYHQRKLKKDEELIGGIGGGVERWSSIITVEIHRT